MFTRVSQSFVTKVARIRPPAYSATAGVVIGLSGTVLYLLNHKRIHLETTPTDREPSGVQASQFHKAIPQNGTVLDKLRQFEESHFPGRGTGISRFDIVKVASNNPIEDYHCESILPVPSGYWSFFAVLDGHNGWRTSAWLRDTIIPAVAGAIGDVYARYEPLVEERNAESEPENPRMQNEERGLRPPPPPPHAIDEAIKETFRRLDDDIVHEPIKQVFSSSSKAAAIELLARAHAGSCALLAFYDSKDRLLRIALTGDSRAVLGRRVRDPGERPFYEVHVLSADQNGHNPAEEARMSALHPGEKIMEKGRVLGWGMSRAFGDATYKWSIETQTRLNKEYLGDRIHANVKTPPYFTAEPEITTTAVKPGDFLILATDGLWDCLTNEEAVGLVGLWLDEKKKYPNAGNPEVVKRDGLPVKVAEDRTVMYPYWGSEKRFVNVDGNAATHLTRSALGGADSDLTAGLLRMTLPRSRRYRDDITTIVVFFD